MPVKVYSTNRHGRRQKKRQPLGMATGKILEIAEAMKDDCEALANNCQSGKPDNFVTKEILESMHGFDRNDGVLITATAVFIVVKRALNEVSDQNADGLAGSPNL